MMHNNNFQVQNKCIGEESTQTESFKVEFSVVWSKNGVAMEGDHAL